MVAEGHVLNGSTIDSPYLVHIRPPFFRGAGESGFAFCFLSIRKIPWQLSKDELALARGAKAIYCPGRLSVVAAFRAVERSMLGASVVVFVNDKSAA